MGPRLASLALLLLALCRHSSYGREIKIESLNTMSSSSSSSVIKKEEAKTLTENLGKPTPQSKGPTTEQIKKLMKNLGNTMLGSALMSSGANLPEFIARSLEHGMLCEAKDENNLQLIKDTIYNGNVSPDTNAKERADFKDTPKAELKIDCDAPPTTPALAEVKCLCDEKQPGLWCMLVRIHRQHGTKMGTCPDDALKNLKEAGTGTLGKQYDLETFDDNQGFKELISGDAKSIDTLTKNLDDELTNFFCDAMNPAVVKAVKEVYAADVSYWLAEGILYGLLFGPASTNLDGACKNSEFTSNEYGKCVCGKDTGFTFCIYKVLAEFFKEVGFLDCEKKKFVKDKKPTAVPKIGSGSGGGGGGGGTNAAATSTLLLAPTAAATLLLQLRH